MYILSTKELKQLEIWEKRIKLILGIIGVVLFITGLAWIILPVFEECTIVLP